VSTRKLKLSQFDDAQIDKLKERFGFSSDDEVVRHALALLQIAGESADPDGTIYVGKDENAVSLCLHKQKKK
jgi:hypothetical protein